MALLIDRPDMFTLKTLNALVQEAGLESAKRAVCRQPTRGADQGSPRVHIFGRKATHAGALE
jgi:hypothetical protein